MSVYSKIKRWYTDVNDNLELKQGWFIAQGQMADGHLAYTRLDDNGEAIEGEEGAYIQLRGIGCLYMERI